MSFIVATVLTVYGIETVPTLRDSQETRIGSLQQYLPFTVLKHLLSKRLLLENNVGCNSTYRLRYWNFSNWLKHILSICTLVATALTVYGIETHHLQFQYQYYSHVATALTACGIETPSFSAILGWNFLRLQQHLSLAVLKPESFFQKVIQFNMLQQHLPLAVLKLLQYCRSATVIYTVATVLTACGIETPSLLHYRWSNLRCNSTYRLRYWNNRPCLPPNDVELVATVLTVYGIETLNLEHIY